MIKTHFFFCIIYITIYILYISVRYAMKNKGGNLGMWNNNCSCCGKEHNCCEKKEFKCCETCRPVWECQKTYKCFEFCKWIKPCEEKHDCCEKKHDCCEKDFDKRPDYC